MSENGQGADAPQTGNGPEGGAGGDSVGGAEDERPPLVVNAQYIKDMSFEAPTTPAVFALMQKSKPEIALNVDVAAQAVQENVHEVVLKVKAQCKIGETVAFIMELDYGGMFTINVEDQYVQAVLLIECPRMLFPFARHILSNATRDGGFPPLLIGPVDFVAMYQQRAQQQQAADAAAQPTTDA